MKVSVFTPSHDPIYLDEAYDSLLHQTYTDWEWIVLLNNKAHWKPELWDDRVGVAYSTNQGIGALKKHATMLCGGDILVELDHDDILAPDALEKIVQAFRENPDVGLVYSDSGMMDPDGKRFPYRYRGDCGWEYKLDCVGSQLGETILSFKPTPHNVGYIWYAPNHVRAFRRTTYEFAGGYNADRDVLDDQELMIKMYLQADFYHIEETLYLQRWHEKNTQRDADINARIQIETVELYDNYFEALALTWAERNNLLSLDLGGAHNSPSRYLSVDIKEGPGVDCVANALHLPFPDNSIGVIRAVDFLEHVKDAVGLMNELYRVLVPGGILISATPSTDGRGAFQDPTHVAFWNENSFWYYTDKNLQKYVPEISCKFQVSRLITAFPSDWHRQHHIPYVMANLIALKEEHPRNGGPINWG